MPTMTLDLVPADYRIDYKVKLTEGEVIRCAGRTIKLRQCSRKGIYKHRHKGSTVYVCIHHRPQRPVAQA